MRYDLGMRRVTHYMLNALTVLSLVLCVATVGLWIESYSVERVVIWNGSIDYWTISNHGLLRFVRTEWLVPNGDGRRQAYNDDGVFSGETRPYGGEDCAIPARNLHWRMGFTRDEHRFGDGVERRRLVTFPHGWLACMLGAWPTIATLRRRRRRRKSGRGFAVLGPVNH